MMVLTGAPWGDRAVTQATAKAQRLTPIHAAEDQSDTA
jgi:hypothetical protein